MNFSTWGFSQKPHTTVIPRFNFFFFFFGLAPEHRSRNPAEEILLFLSRAEEFLWGSNVLGWEKGAHTILLKRNMVMVEGFGRSL